MHRNNKQTPALWGTAGTGQEGPMLWSVPVCGQMGRCGHWLVGLYLSFTLSQVSRHVCLSIVRGPLLPLQGAQLLLKGTSWIVPVDQTSNLILLCFGLFPALCCLALQCFFLHTHKLQRILHGEFSIPSLFPVSFFQLLTLSKISTLYFDSWLRVI